MRRIVQTLATLALALSFAAAPLAMAQTRSTGSSTTRSTGSSSTTRSSGAQTTRSSGTSSQSVTRSTGSSTSSATRSTGSSSQQSVTRSTGSSSSATRSTGTSSQSVTRSTGSSTSSATRSTGSSSSAATRSTGSSTQSVTRSTSSSASSSTRSSGSVSSSSATATRSTVANVTRSGLTNSSQAVSSQKSGNYRDDSGNYRYEDDFRMDNNHNVNRIPPRHRDFLPMDRPRPFYGDYPHYFGYRIQVIPAGYRRIHHWGIDYYFYDGIYYRPYGGYYVVCRPPFGTPLERAIDRAILRSLRFSYYVNTYRTYNTVFDNYNVIAQQNLIIAQNNARIAAQNRSYALNSQRALTAYELANKLGLVQSYAYANSEYFYQDGVFYTISPSGAYSTIVPPAGALVTSLPDDYETIVMNGVEYYMVDNTVYRTILYEGEPLLEVLGQMYGSLYNQYNIYR